MGATSRAFSGRKGFRRFRLLPPRTFIGSGKNRPLADTGVPGPEEPENTLSARGPPGHECAAVHAALHDLELQASEVPVASLLTALRRFRQRYTDWNDVDDPDPALAERKRAAALDKLADARTRLAITCRKSHHVLTKNLDLKRAEAMTTCLTGVAKAFPELFRALSKAADVLVRRLAGP